MRGAWAPFSCDTVGTFLGSQLAQIASSFGGLCFVGKPETIADAMEKWLASDACDRFNVMFPHVPNGLDEFVDCAIQDCNAPHYFIGTTRV